MRTFVIHPVIGNEYLVIIVERLPGVRIHIETRKIAARNVDPYPVSLFENVRGRVKFDHEFVRGPRLHQLFLVQ